MFLKECLKGWNFKIILKEIAGFVAKKWIAQRNEIVNNYAFDIGQI